MSRNNSLFGARRDTDMGSRILLQELRAERASTVGYRVAYNKAWGTASACLDVLLREEIICHLVSHSSKSNEARAIATRDMIGCILNAS